MECQQANANLGLREEDNLMTSVQVVIDNDGFEEILDYMPIPEFDMMGKMEKFEIEIQQGINNLHNSMAKPPFISSLYGPIRKKSYRELTENLRGWPEAKKIEQKTLFFKNLDLKYAKLFQDKIEIRKLYDDYISQNNFEVSVFKFHHNLNLAVGTESVLNDSKAEVFSLSIDWYIAVDKAVDALTRCQLYGLDREMDHNKIYEKLKKVNSKKFKQTWTEKVRTYWTVIMKLVKQRLELKAGREIYKDNQEFDLPDMLTYLAYILGETIVSSCHEVSEFEGQKKALSRAKRFLETLNKNMEFITKRLNERIEKCLMATTKEQANSEKQELENMIQFLFSQQEEFLILDSETSS